MPHVLCVINPKSRDGFVARRWRHLATMLRDRGLDPVVLDLTAGELHARLAAALAGDAAGTPAIVGVGGDGTHMAIINAMLAMQRGRGRGAPPLPPYAPCAFGTGNDVAKSIGLTPGERGLSAALDNILLGDPRPYDLGCSDGHYFADALCLGGDAAILGCREHLMDRVRREPWLQGWLRGYSLYALAAALSTVRARRWPAKVMVDGELWYDGPLLNLVINNCRIHAGEFDLTPGARTDDGWLDAVIVRHLPMYGYRYAAAWRRWPDACKLSVPHEVVRAPRCRGRRFDVQLTGCAPLQMDGEVFPPTDNLRVEVAPGAVLMRQPRPATAADAARAAEREAAVRRLTQ